MVAVQAVLDRLNALDTQFKAAEGVNRGRAHTLAICTGIMTQYPHTNKDGVFSAHALKEHEAKDVLAILAGLDKKEDNIEAIATT